METFELTIADTNSNYPITINITSSSSASNSSNSKYIITVFPDDRLFLGNPDSRLASTVVGITNNNELNLNQSTTMRFSVNQVQNYCNYYCKYYRIIFIDSVITRIRISVCLLGFSTKQ